MKKINLATTLICLVLVFGTNFGCQKEDSQNPNSNTPNQNGVQYAYSSTRLLTDTEIEDIADDHNTQALSILEDFDFDANDYIVELVDQYESRYSSSTMEMSQQDYEDFYDDLDTEAEQLSIISNEMNDYTEFENLIDDVETEIENATSLTDLSDALDDLIDDVPTNFSGSDIDGALLFLSVVKSSAELWMPSNMGTNGEGFAYIENDFGPDLTDEELAIAWKKTLIADGLGATAALMYIGLGLAAGPVSLGALAVFVGVRAAVASLSSLVIQSM